MLYTEVVNKAIKNSLCCFVHRWPNNKISFSEILQW